MMKSIVGLMLAVFFMALTVDGVDARSQWVNRHNYVWHNGKHYKKYRRHRQYKRHHRRHRKPSPPPIVVATIDVSTQSMRVTVNGLPYAYWAVSTARKGYRTPHGSFRVQRTAKVYYSKKYDNSPMPNSVFFLGGNAIHGTYHLRSLGRPASHGCVRLAPRNAETLFGLVQYYGPRRVRIVVQD